MKKIEQNQIIEKIKNIIFKYYPIEENRIDSLMNGRNSEMDIDFIFNGNSINETTINVFNGNKFSKTLVEKNSIKGLVDKQIIIELISFILSDHDVISNFYYNDKRIVLLFNVDLRENNMKGIGCQNILLTLDFSEHINFNQITDEYLYEIINNFYEKIKNTEQFKKDYDCFLDELKTAIIMDLSSKELSNIFKSLNEEDMRNILLNMSSDDFTDLYTNCEKSNQLVKKIR